MRDSDAVLAKEAVMQMIEYCGCAVNGAIAIVILRSRLPLRSAKAKNGAVKRALRMAKIASNISFPADVNCGVPSPIRFGESGFYLGNIQMAWFLRISEKGLESSGKFPAACVFAYRSARP